MLYYIVLYFRVAIYLSRRRGAHTYLSRRRWAPRPIYLGCDNYLSTNPGKGGQLFAYCGGVYLAIYLAINPKGDGHPSKRRWPPLPIYLKGDGHSPM